MLVMGPIYSMKDFDDRKRACKEALRIAKPGAPVFIAFCLQDAPLIHEIFMSEDPASEIAAIGYDRENALVTDNTGSSRLLDTISMVDELIDAVCKENDAHKVSDTRGTNRSYGLNYQKTGKELMTKDELAVMDGGKCIMQLRGVRPFFSNKYDITKHKRYKYLSDYDPKLAFDIEKYMSRKLVLKKDDPIEVVDIDLSEDELSN